MTRILIFFMLLCINSSFAKIIDECEKVYAIVEEQPEYKKGTPDLMKYISTEVLSELKCMGEDANYQSAD